jgi:uncharacterized protein (DUF1800 family)
MAAAGLATRVLTGSTGPRYVARAYPRTPVPTARELHMLNRFGYGFTPEALTRLRAAGGETKWFLKQLTPVSVAENATAKAVDGWFPTIRHTPTTIWANDKSGTHGAWEYARDLSNYSILKRIYSTRGVLESMVELWSNHLHVESQHYPAFATRMDYDRVIRKHALGTYRDLLVATTLHPSMLHYLDNAKSKRGSFNENHGRELLELHTVGLAARYTEDEVKASAKILSGHTVSDAHVAYYEPARHTTGAVSVLGFTDPNANAADAGLATRYLEHLARHPATARTVARKIAVRFVNDSPSEKLVAHLAAAYLKSGTDIKATLKALIAHPEFWSSAGKKVRTPIDDVVATCRAVRVQARAPKSTDSFAHAITWTVRSTPCFQWPRPDGPPDRAASWASTTRMLNAWRMHVNYAGAWWPDEQATYPKATAFLPAKSIRFDQLVDHLCRRVLGRRSNARILQAACEACNAKPAEVVTSSHALMRWNFVRLMAVLLDSPYHMTR